MEFLRTGETNGGDTTIWKGMTEKFPKHFKVINIHSQLEVT